MTTTTGRIDQLPEATNESGDIELDLSPLSRVERRGTSTGWTVYAGSGSDRQQLSIDHGPLLSWLLGIDKATSRSALQDALAGALGIDPEEATGLLDTFVDAEVLVSRGEAERLRAQGAHWEEWGWRDAFDFHFSCRGLQFEPLDHVEFREAIKPLFADTGGVGEQPGPYKEYSVEPTCVLPGDAGNDVWTSLGDALLTNWPVEHFLQRRIDQSELSAVLRFGVGVQRELPTIMGPHVFKSTPSGGARHPIEAYVIAREVDGLAPGIYHYHPKTGELRPVADETVLGRVDAACFNKPGIVSAPCVVVMTVRWIRHNWKYRYSRSYRMALIDTGHVLQAVALAGRVAGLSVYSTYAVHDDEMSSLLGLDDDCVESPLFAFGLGHGASR